MKNSKQKSPIEEQAEKIFKRVKTEGSTVILEIERRVFDTASGEKLSKPHKVSIPLRGAYDEIVRLIQYCGYNEKKPTVKFIEQKGIEKKIVNKK